MRIAVRHDGENGRNMLRLIFDEDRGHVYVETLGNHDGVSVATKVRLDRAEFSALVRQMGVL